MSKPIMIRLFGAGCSRCNEAEEMINEFFSTNQIVINLEKVTDVKEMVKNGIVVTPAIEINNELLFHGRIPKVSELETWLSQYNRRGEKE